MSLERRGGGKWPGFGVSYTLAKAIRDVEGFLFLAQDQLNPAAEKSLASNNRTHQLVGRMNWLAARRVPAGRHPPVPLRFTVERHHRPRQQPRYRAERPAGSRQSRAAIRYDRNTYFGDFTDRVGNLGRNANIGPSFVTLDARLSKLFQVQRYRFEAFVEAFNATNKVNFASPQGNLRSALFGTSTSIQGNQRQVELGFRVDF